MMRRRGTWGGALLLAVVCVLTLTAPAPAAGPVEYWPSVFGNTRNSGFNSGEHVIGPSGLRKLEPVWARTPVGLTYAETPLAVGGRVFATCGDQDICAFRASTGRRLWRVDGDALAWPSVGGGLVFVALDTHPLRFAALRADTGEQEWVRTFDDAAQTTDWSTVRNGVVYLGDSEGYLHALDAATGATKWSRRVGVARIPAFSDAAMFAVAVDRGSILLRAFDPLTGRQKWVGQYGTALVAPVVGHGRVYVRSEDGDVAAYDVDGCGERMCAPVWHVPSAVPLGMGPALANGVLYFTGWRGEVTALRARDGHRLWSSAAVSEEVAHPPTVANGVVYVTHQGAVRAFRASGCGTSVCDPLWTRRVGEDVARTSAVVVADGRLFLTAGFALYQFAPPSASRADPRGPSAPREVSAEAFDSEANVRWSAPADLAGFPVIGHRVRVSDGRVIWTRSRHSVLAVKGLTNGTTYTFWVAAITVAGVGAESPPSNPVRPDLRHSPPTDVTATGGLGEATVSWTPSPHTFGDDSLTYEIYAHPAAGSPFLVATVENTDHATFAVPRGSYTFTLMTVAHNVTSDESAPSNAVVVG